MRVMKHAVGGCETKGLIRENVDLGFCAGAAVGSGFMGMIRENVDLRFGVGAPGGEAGSGTGGLICENADSEWARRRRFAAGRGRGGAAA